MLFGKIQIAEFVVIPTLLFHQLWQISIRVGKLDNLGFSKIRRIREKETMGNSMNLILFRAKGPTTNPIHLKSLIASQCYFLLIQYQDTHLTQNFNNCCHLIRAVLLVEDSLITRRIVMPLARPILLWLQHGTPRHSGTEGANVSTPSTATATLHIDTSLLFFFF